MKKIFVGIDVSKAKLDVSVFGNNSYKQFSNHTKGFENLLEWLKKCTQSEAFSEALFCFEHTGIYSLPLALFLQESGIDFSMISALQIKRSMGIARGKNDKVDSKRIAEYAFRHQDILVFTKLPSRSILKLHPLLTLRDRLVRSRAGYEASRMEQSNFLPEKEYPEIYKIYNDLISELKQKTKSLESAIKKIIEDDKELKTTFDLVTSIKGVGLIIASYLIVYTHNFSRFHTWRKFACYAGIAPFDFQSGTSVHGKPRVNPIANRQMKKLLHIAAMHAAHSDKEMVDYYKKRLDAGYNKMSTLNAIRNKVLARIFAVMNRKSPYVELMKHVA